ncbi:ADP-ribosylglycohydrolase family protein [Phytohabitans sp. LJ34]|uniref:ADP-ribosylglycohydrolase family protein n=1 Tax=Phytohabitans sp. LJ34 TaxID=3452217 RepID=UPI003F89AB9B
MRLTWTLPEELLPYELMALRDEGHDVSEVEARWAAAGGRLAAPVEGASVPGDPALRGLALELLDAVPAPVTPPLTVTPEPSPGPRPDPDRLRGAWVGRAVGCVLGKPVEKIPRRGIREILRASGRWPLSGYFTAEGLPPDVAERWPWNRRSAVDSLAENIDGTPEDDDLNFALLALRLLERHGRDFTSADVAQAWLDWLPAGRVFTAERAAYRNLLLGFTPPQTALHHNPFREWIGAQIRTDVYGWAAPGRPKAAAALAYRDAVVSHVGDGVSGAMWVAALTAAAVVASTVDEVLDAGESVLSGGPFAAAVTEARALAGDWESVVDAIEKRHGHLHWVHARNNAALVAAALAHSGGDFDRGICAVVSGGWDTDSNGATVGSILGALSGASAIRPEWTAPLKGRLRSSVGGFDGVTFEELAARTAEVTR